MCAFIDMCVKCKHTGKLLRVLLLLAIISRITITSNRSQKIYIITHKNYAYLVIESLAATIWKQFHFIFPVSIILDPFVLSIL